MLSNEYAVKILIIMTALSLLIPVSMVGMNASGLSGANAGPSEVMKNRGGYGVYLPPAQWTVVLYMAGDNSLSSAAVDDLSEVEAADMNDGINVLALVDERGSGNTHLHYISSTSNMEIPLSEVNSSWSDEVNMADPEVLSDILLFAETHSYSSKYALVMWDHGNGWAGLCVDGSDSMEIDEMESALSDVQSSTGVRLSLLGFDACMMGNTEVFYQFRSYADYFVGSAETEPSDGWDYKAIFDDIRASDSPWELGKKIVDTYVTSYSDGEPNPEDDTVTCALVRNTYTYVDGGLDYGLASNINDLAQCLIKGVNEYQYMNDNPIKSAYSHSIKYSDPRYMDLYNFTYALSRAQYPPGAVGTDIKAISSRIVDSWNDFVYTANTGGDYWAHTGGLSIYFDHYVHTVMDNGFRVGSYNETDFCRETMWDEFTKEYDNPSGNGMLNNQPTVSIISTDIDSSGMLTASGQATDALVDTNSITAVEARLDDNPFKAVNFTPGLPGTVNWKFRADTTDMPNGQHHLTVRAWDGMEYSIYNSQSVGFANIDVSNPLPDLQVQSITYNNWLNITVNNTGTISSPSTQLLIFCADTLVDTLDVTSLIPGESITLHSTAQLAPGFQTIGAVVDAGRKIMEEDENNNALTVEVKVSGYNIVLTAPDGIQYIEEGSTRDISLSLTNDGTFDTHVNLTVSDVSGWETTLSTNSILLPTNSTQTVTLTLDPVDAYTGSNASFTITAISQENSSASDVAVIHASVVLMYTDGTSQGQWTVENNGTGSSWGISDYYSGSWYCGENLVGQYLPLTDSRLISPEVDLSGLDAPYLDMSHYYSSEGGYDGGAVYVLENGTMNKLVPDGGYPASYIKALDNTDGFSGHVDDTIESRFDLSDYEGSTIRVVLRFASDEGINDFGWAVEDLYVSGQRRVHDASITDVRAEGVTVPGASLDLSADVLNNGLVTDTIKVNMAVSGTQVENLGNLSVTLAPGASSTLHWSFVPSEEGIYTFTATAYLATDMDSSNNAMSIDVGIYSNRPSVIITAPENGSEVDGNVTIEGTAGDSDGTVQRVEVSIDGGAWQSANATAQGFSTWVFVWDTSSYNNGTYTVSARSFDGTYYSDIYNITLTVNHRVENTPPTVHIDLPVSGSTYTTQQQIDFVCSASDADGDTLSFRWVSNKTGLLSTQQNFTSKLQIGLHTITVYVDDGHGGQASDSVNIKIKAVNTTDIFFDDMEGGENGWITTGKWELGTPTMGPGTAHSPDNCWGTVIDGYYGDTDADWNMTHEIDLHGSNGSITLEIWTWYDMETGYDGGQVLVSRHGANDWKLLTPTSGYDAVISTGYESHIAGEEAFTGTTQDWVNKQFDLSNFAGYDIDLRFRFVSDVSTSDYFGWYIDDVRVFQGGGNMPPIAVISQPTEGSQFQQSETISFDGSSSYDPEGAHLTYKWVSNIDGLLSTEATFEMKLTAGNHNITLTVEDPAGLKGEAHVNITVLEGVNNPPTAIISTPHEGQSFQNPTQISFDGSSSFDPEGDTLTYTWTSSIDGTLSHEASFSTELSAGSHRITLKVKDSAGLEDSAQVNITVLSENNTPPVIVDNYPESLSINAKEGEHIHISVNASDDNIHDNLAYTWKINDQAAEDFAHGVITTDGSQSVSNGKLTLYTYLNWDPNYEAAGQYTVKVDITDGSETVSASWSLTILNVNRPPVALISSPQDGASYKAGTEITFDGSHSTDPDGDTLNYIWSSDRDGTLGSGAKLTKVLTPGDHTITLLVTDTGSLSATDKVKITVETSGKFKADAGSDTVVNIGKPLKFNASGTYDELEDYNGDGVIEWGHEGANLSFSWDLGDGNKSTKRVFNHSYSKAGTYEVNLTVTNSIGQKAYDSITVRVNAVPEVKLIPQAPVWKEGESMLFTCSATDPDGDAISYYLFEFLSPNGITTILNQSVDTVSFSFTGIGTAHVLVMVYDEYGGAGSASAVVDITKYGIDEPKITSPQNNEVVSGEITISGTCQGINIKSLQVNLPDKGWVEADGGENNWTTWSVKWDTTSVADGDYTIIVKSESDVGDFDAEVELPITVSNGGEPVEETTHKTLDQKLVDFAKTPNGALTIIMLVFFLIIFAAVISIRRKSDEYDYDYSYDSDVDGEDDEGEGDLEISDEIIELDNDAGQGVVSIGVYPGDDDSTDNEDDGLPEVSVVMEIPCPKCGELIPVERSEDKEEALVVCPSCGAKGRVKFEKSVDYEDEILEASPSEDAEDTEDAEEDTPVDGEDGKKDKKRRRGKKTGKKVKKSRRPSKKRRTRKKKQEEDETEIDMSSTMVRF